MARFARFPFLVLIQYSLSKGSPLRRPQVAPASSVLQDLSKTVVTKTVVTTITTQTQETKTVVTKEKPADDAESSRFDNDSSNVRQSTSTVAEGSTSDAHANMLPVSEGSTSMAEVFASLRRAAPRDEVETIRFPSSPSAYFRKDSHGDAAGEDPSPLPDQSPPEQNSVLLDLQEKHEVKDAEEGRHEEPKHFAKSQPAALPTVLASKQDLVTDAVEKINSTKSVDPKTITWKSLISISQGSDSENAMLPAACRLLFFLIGVVIVVLAACGCASAALLMPA